MKKICIVLRIKGLFLFVLSSGRTEVFVMKVKAIRKHKKKKSVYVFFVGQDLMMPFESISVNIYLINYHFLFCACYKQFHLQNLNAVGAVISAHGDLLPNIF